MQQSHAAGQIAALRNLPLTRGVETVESRESICHKKLIRGEHPRISFAKSHDPEIHAQAHFLIDLCTFNTAFASLQPRYVVIAW